MNITDKMNLQSKRHKYLLDIITCLSEKNLRIIQQNNEDYSGK